MECVYCSKWVYFFDPDKEAACICTECNAKAIKTENEELKRENEELKRKNEELKSETEELKSKVSFLMFWDPLDSGPDYDHQSTDRFFSDVVLVAADLDSGIPVANSVPVPANKGLLASRSPVFRAMLETEMKERLSGIIKLSDVSYEALLAFVNFLYTAETPLDDDLACDLIILADKYEVKHLKTYCEKFLISKLKWENSLKIYSLAHQHNSKTLLDAALSVILDNMDDLIEREEYLDLVKKDLRLVVDIYEAYFSKTGKRRRCH